MSWPGVPFKLLDAGNVEQLFLKLSSLPKLTIDSPTDYNQLALTVGATFLGGLIPALIAWRTFYVNAKNVKKERQEQQRFLKAERSKQQIFMMSERASQFASMKEDREMQLSISQKTINAQVISVNRQKWIADVRENIAEFCSLAFDHHNDRIDYLIHERAMNLESENFKKSNYSEDMKVRYEKAADDYTKCLERTRTTRSNMDKLKFLILLSLNHEEKETHEIHSSMHALQLLVNTLIIDNETGMLKNVTEVYSELIDQSNKLMDIVRMVLKREWERVKLCE